MSPGFQVLIRGGADTRIRKIRDFGVVMLVGKENAGGRQLFCVQLNFLKSPLIFRYWSEGGPIPEIFRYFEMRVYP